LAATKKTMGHLGHLSQYEIDNTVKYPHPAYQGDPGFDGTIVKLLIQIPTF
jgi:hypothetical protein